MDSIELVGENTSIEALSFEAFLNAVVWNALSKNTRRAYEHAYNQLLAWLNGRQLSDALLTVYITSQ